MSRQTLDIKYFNKGVISSLDEEDIPQEASSDSLNIDGDVADGILQGIPSDTVFEAPTGSDITNIRLGEFIEHDGIYDLIYHDKDANTICVVTDFYNTNTEKKKITFISSLTSDNVTMVKSNKEVHIGIEDTYAYWVGRVDHGQFDWGYSWTIASIADSGGEVIVTTDAAHSLAAGDMVRISGATGTDAASMNGIWIVGTVDNNAKTFILTGSTYSGTTLTLPGTAEIYLTYEYAQCERSGGTSVGEYSISVGTENTPADGFFQSGILYRWATSLIYDGLQESPLFSNANEDVASGESDYYPITITADSATPTAGNTTGLSAFNKRVTGVNLYRADSIDGIAGNLGLFRLVASIDINDDFWIVATNDQAVIIYDYGTYYKFATDGAIFPGNPVTYEDNTGIAENFQNPRLYYALSTSGNGYHFVGKSTQPDLSGGEKRRIFRSKLFRYDMFDYYTDFLEMPEPITAMEFSNGKLYVFSSNQVYRVNPEGLFIEDSYEDAGAQGQRAVHENEYGLFFCNVNGAWMIQNGQINPISLAIKNSKSGQKSWDTFRTSGLSTLTDFIVTSDGLKGYVLFINERTNTGQKIFCWAYNTARDRWDAWDFTGSYDSSVNDGVVKGKDGEVYLSCDSQTYKLLRPSVSTYTQAWEWYSQDFTFGKTRQDKSIVKAKVDASGTVSVNYGFEGAAVTTSYTQDTYINEYKMSIRLKLNAAAVASGSAYTNNVDSMEIIYRILVGNR